MSTLQQRFKTGTLKRKDGARTPALKQCPQVRGTVMRARIVTPRKPNSARRPVGKVVLVNKNRVTAHIPGIGHNIRRYSKVFVRGGGSRDLPGVRYSLIRGVLDFAGIHTKKRRRSIYGTSQPSFMKRLRRKERKKLLHEQKIEEEKQLEEVKAKEKELPKEEIIRKREYARFYTKDKYFRVFSIDFEPAINLYYNSTLNIFFKRNNIFFGEHLQMNSLPTYYRADLNFSFIEQNYLLFAYNYLRTNFYGWFNDYNSYRFWLIDFFFKKTKALVIDYNLKKKKKEDLLKLPEGAELSEEDKILLSEELPETAPSAFNENFDKMGFDYFCERYSLNFRGSLTDKLNLFKIISTKDYSYKNYHDKYVIDSFNFLMTSKHLKKKKL